MKTKESVHESPAANLDALRTQLAQAEARAATTGGDAAAYLAAATKLLDRAEQDAADRARLALLLEHGEQEVIRRETEAAAKQAAEDHAKHVTAAAAADEREQNALLLVEQRLTELCEATAGAVSAMNDACTARAARDGTGTNLALFNTTRAHIAGRIAWNLRWSGGLGSSLEMLVPVGFREPLVATAAKE